MPPGAIREFEEELTDLQLRFPEMLVVRLDELFTLDHNDYYYDFVHLNMYGQQIATEAFINRLKELPILP